MVTETRAGIDLGASLAQALRYVNTWKSKTVVVKYGGSMMASEVRRAGGDTVIEDLVLLKGAGVDPVLVHGGGPEITRMLVTLLSTNGFIPVIASIGIGAEGQSYNLNADHAAGALAAALGASKFILLTDVPGVLAGSDSGRPISTLRAEQARHLISDGVISRGMIPKVEACLVALSAGVPTAHIIGGRQPHALLVELFTEEGVGTMITP